MLEVFDASVIIPIGRVDEDLALQFEALESQTFEGSWELVLSLNAADPRCRADLEHLSESLTAPEVSIVDSSEVRSASHARNVGASHAKSDVLLFCDGDDIADPDWIKNLLAAVSPSVAVGGHLDESVLAISGQEHWRPPATPNGLPSFLGHEYLVSANMGVYKEVFEKAGGFKEDLLRGEDIALSWDFLRQGITLSYVNTAVIHYRHRRGLSSMAHQHYLYGRGMSQLLVRYGVPTEEGADDTSSKGGLRHLKPNGQKVEGKSFVYFVRRGSLAIGRVVGLLVERIKPAS